MNNISILFDNISEFKRLNKGTSDY